MNDVTPNSVADAGALAIWIAAFFNFLPSVAAFLSVVWISLRIAETATVQKLLGRYAWIKKGEADGED